MIKIALFGIGYVVQRCHLPVLKSNNKFKIIGFYDTNIKIIEKYKRYIKYYSDSEELFNVKPDLVLIATPSYLHSKFCIDALSRDINVLVEKPIAINEEQVNSIKKYLDRTTAKLFVGLHLRHTTQIRILKSIIHNKTLGEIISFQSVFTNHVKRRKTFSGYDLKREFGGGSLFDLAYHHIDLFSYLFDEKLLSVRCNIKAINNEDDFVCLDLKFENIIGQGLYSSAVYNDHQIKIYFEDGIISIDFFKSPGFFILKKKNTVKNKLLSELKYSLSIFKMLKNLSPSMKNAPYSSQLEALYYELNGFKTNIATFEDGINALKVVLSAYNSNLIGGKWVDIL